MDPLDPTAFHSPMSTNFGLEARWTISTPSPPSLGLKTTPLSRKPTDAPSEFQIQSTFKPKQACGADRKLALSGATIKGVSKHWHSLPREAVESTPLEMFNLGDI